MPTPNEQLRRERQLRGWSQGYLAERISVPDYYISRWERGEVLPSPYYQQRLCEVFGKTAEELGMLAKASPTHRVPDQQATGHQTAKPATDPRPSSPVASLRAAAPADRSPASAASPRLQLPLTPFPLDDAAAPLPLTAPSPVSPSPRSPWLSPSHRFLVVAFVLLFLLASVTVGALYAFRKPTNSATMVGTLLFLSSGQGNAQHSQGVDDEVQVALHSIATPAAGTSYYAWLKAAPLQEEGLWTLLGKLRVQHGTAQLPAPYQDPHHADLLIAASSFLVTQEASAMAPTQPSPDRSTWRFYSDPPQITLAHLRHLLANSPELDLRQLYGGLGIWFLRNTEELVGWAGTARESLQSTPPDTPLVHRQLIAILDDIDGADAVALDVPPHTPLAVTAHHAQIALVGPPPHLEPAGSLYNTPGEVVPGYVYLVREHLDAAVSVPQATPEQRQLATQIDNAINQVTSDLEQVRTDARLLVGLPEQQLATPQAQSTLNDLVAAAQRAYAGPSNAGQFQEGATWIYASLQRMASFSFAVQPYAPQSSMGAILTPAMASKC